MTKSLNLLNKIETMFDEQKRKPGRPVVEGSARQLKLAAQQVRAQLNGGVAKRGRPVVADSERQKRLAERESKLAAGIEIKRGRPKVNLVDLMNQLNELNLEPVVESIIEPVVEAIVEAAPAKKTKKKK